MFSIKFNLIIFEDKQINNISIPITLPGIGRFNIECIISPKKQIKSIIVTSTNNFSFKITPPNFKIYYINNQVCFY